MHDLLDSNHVRYKLVKTSEGKPFNWLFIPGGPGIDSCYFDNLLNMLKLPGNIWLIDFPGNGDNTQGVPSDYNFDAWFDLFIPTIKQFENPVLVGHSFGGMFPFLFPELENILRGFVILNSAPTLWFEAAKIYAKQFHLPDISSEMDAYINHPTKDTFKVALEALSLYFFPPTTLAKGRALLDEVTFQFLPAVWWQRKAIELNFSAKWIPQSIPTLIISGVADCICPYTLFQNDKRFDRSNIRQQNIQDAGHFSWVEKPEEVREFIHQFANSLSDNVSLT